MIIVSLKTVWPFNMTDSEASIIIPTLVSLLVFFLGLLAKLVYDHLQKRHTIIVHRSVVFEWTELIIDAVKNQSQSLKKLSQSLVNSKSLLPEPYAYSRSMSDKLGELTAEKIFTEFVVNCRCKKKVEDKRTKLSFNLVSQYDYLTSVESIIKEHYEVYNREANDIRKQWNSLMLQIQHEIDVVKPETLKDYQVHDSIRKTLNAFFQGNKQADFTGDIGDLYDRLIVPLNNTVYECKRAFPEVRCCQAVYECARKMLILHDNWKSFKMGYAEVFSTYASSIDKSLDLLRQAIDYFKDSTKVVCWVK